MREFLVQIPLISFSSVTVFVYVYIYIFFFQYKVSYNFKFHFVAKSKDHADIILQPKFSNYEEVRIFTR